ncbi:hypothetical protein [Cryptosporangium sp. NPDC051539]|uniref:hypothetical protein n=1 Tax=Cryptosporangium sp. NPDC051539 TaxID=3363962 RepID=UPI0037B92638
MSGVGVVLGGDYAAVHRESSSTLVRGLVSWTGLDPRAGATSLDRLPCCDPEVVGDIVGLLASSPDRWSRPVTPSGRTAADVCAGFLSALLGEPDETLTIAVPDRWFGTPTLSLAADRLTRLLDSAPTLAPYSCCVTAGLSEQGSALVCHVDQTRVDVGLCDTDGDTIRLVDIGSAAFPDVVQQLADAAQPPSGHEPDQLREAILRCLAPQSDRARTAVRHWRAARAYAPVVAGVRYQVPAGAVLDASDAVASALTTALQGRSAANVVRIGSLSPLPIVGDVLGATAITATALTAARGAAWLTNFSVGQGHDVTLRVNQIRGGRPLTADLPLLAADRPPWLDDGATPLVVVDDDFPGLVELDVRPLSGPASRWDARVTDLRPGDYRVRVRMSRHRPEALVLRPADGGTERVLLLQEAT